MTAEAILEKSVRYDRGGEPLEVIIPYKQFIDFIEDHGLDLTENEKRDLREAQADSDAGNKEAFVDFEEIKREFGCTG